MTATAARDDMSPAALARLSDHLAAHLPEPPVGPLRAERLTGGRSNLSYVICDGRSEWVLRRPPFGELAPTAHDMGREYRMLRALAGSAVPVPRALALCEDATVIGAPFLFMERVPGVVWRSPADTRDASTGRRRRASEALVDALVALHAVDTAAVGSTGRGDAADFLARQVRRWTDQWRRWKTRELPAIETAATGLARAVPPATRVGIVHGDYRFDNVILDSEGGIAAVLDWELATVGDPLADLGLLLAYWHDGAPPLFAHHELTAQHGFLGSENVVGRYEALSGRSASHLPFYVALGYFKWAVIREGVVARARARGTADTDIERVGATVPLIAERALDALHDVGPAS